jgi:serine phosphatase RsbU (regulator of sigma subunit)
VSYLPASGGADVGGDWYDAFPLQDGQVGLVIGDVAGHNITSASVMGQVRSLLRAYAIDHADPGEVLSRTNVALARLLPEALASAFYAVLDVGTGGLRYANAGHPPPLIACAGQTVYLEDTTGSMLGASPDGRFSTCHRQLTGGTVLLCYTDGLIENKRRDLTEGLAILARTMQPCAALTAEQVCATAQAGLLGTGQRDDDVCLLAVRLQD